jgi:hypothetical protein
VSHGTAATAGTGAEPRLVRVRLTRDALPMTRSADNRALTGCGDFTAIGHVLWTNLQTRTRFERSRRDSRSLLAVAHAK